MTPFLTALLIVGIVYAIKLCLAPNHPDCRCQSRYQPAYDYRDNTWYGEVDGREVAGPMDKDAMDNWLDVARLNEGSEG